MTSKNFQKEFQSAWWLPDGHSQTLWRKYFPPQGVLHRRQRIELEDGDFIDVDWAGQIDPQRSKGKLCVLVIHGLCGCSESPYVAALQKALVYKKIASVAMNFRGCSGEVNRLARAYHSGVSEDLDNVFDVIARQLPDHKFVLVGYSLGANVLLKWLGENGSHPQVSKAVAVSTPFNLADCSRAMLDGLSQVYGKYFVRNLVKDFRNKQRHFHVSGNSEQSEMIKSLGNVEKISSIWEFDDRITAPLHGFAGAKDYYQRCSSIGFLASIETRTLLLQSSNDPMIPEHALPTRGMLAADVELELSSKGGHVGFICGNRKNWLEQRILRFIEG
jgi:uncharacterized protein